MRRLVAAVTLSLSVAGVADALPSIRLTKTPERQLYPAGAIARYSIEAHNDGTELLPEVKVYDLLDHWFYLLPGSSTLPITGQWSMGFAEVYEFDFGAMAPGERRTLIFDARLDPASFGLVPNAALAEARTLSGGMIWSPAACVRIFIMSGTEIPTLSEMGLGAMAGALLVAALWLRRRRGPATR